MAALALPDGISLDIRGSPRVIRRIVSTTFELQYPLTHIVKWLIASRTDRLRWRGRFPFTFIP